MKLLKIIAVLLAIALLSACGTKTPGNTPDPVPAIGAENSSSGTPDEPDIPTNAEKPEVSDSKEEGKTEGNIPSAETEKAPTKAGESYQASGMYIGMADNNLMVIIEANPEDGKPEKSYKISSEIDLDAMGITEGSLIDLEYIVDENGFKQVTTVSVKH